MTILNKYLNQAQRIQYARLQARDLQEAQECQQVLFTRVDVLALPEPPLSFNSSQRRIYVCLDEFMAGSVSDER
jgi:hypothetical protein